jgi:hypothetical protein
MLFPVALLFCTKFLTQSPTLFACTVESNEQAYAILSWEFPKVFLYFSFVMTQSRIPISKKKKGFELWMQLRTD